MFINNNINVFELRQIFENYLSFERDLVKISDLSFNSFFPQLLTIIKLKFGIDLNIVINEQNYFSTLDLTKTNYIMESYKNKNFLINEINYGYNLNFIVLKLCIDKLEIHLFSCFENIDKIYLSIFENIKNLVEETLVKESNKKALNELESRYKNVIENSLNAVFICDLELHPIFVNDQCQKIYGYSKEEFLSDFSLIEKFILSFYKDKIIAFINNPKNEDNFSLCSHVITKDGKRTYIENTFSKIITENKCIGLQITGREVINNKTSNNEEIDKNKILSLILSHIPMIIWSVDQNGVFQQSFGSGLKALNVEDNQLDGLSIYDTYPEHAEQVMSAMEKYEVKYLSQGEANNQEWYLDNFVFREDNRLVGFSINVTERIQTEKLIKNSPNEKETLLKEIHHRVKNNMQVISSLLSLQSSQIKDKKIKQLFNQCQNRIRSMALAHEILYQSETLSKIDFNKYLNELIKLLSDSFGKANVKFIINSENIFLDITLAIPVCLIINELVSNSLKYAFSNYEEKPLIKISTEQNDCKQIVVEDNGVGLPENINFKETDSLGLQLVNSLVNQINGNIEINNTQGTKFSISF